VSGPIYLDYAATTPVDPDVARAMSEVLSRGAEYGNAGSVTHVFGRRAQARIEAARAQVAALIGAQPEDIIFTSGATEANNLAILGIARGNADRARHLITSRIEHKAVLDPCKQLEREGFAVTYLAPDANGRIAPEAVQAWIRPDTALVSIMHVNNETGVIQDIRAIGDVCRAHGVPFHTDAAQSAGKLPIQLGVPVPSQNHAPASGQPGSALPVDLLSFTAHKLYGPQGVGALYVNPQVRARLRPVMSGGGQERGLRPGTLALHQIVGFGFACEIAQRALADESARIEGLRDRLWAALQCLGGVHLNGEAAPRLAEILNVSFEGVEGESLVTALAASIAVTTGSACSSASGEPSYVLRALGRSTQLAQSSLRFSFGRHTTEADIDTAASAVTHHVERLRSVSPASDEGGAHAASIGSSQGFTPRRASEGAPVISTSTRTTSRSRAYAISDTIFPVESGPASAATTRALLAGAYELDTLSPLARRYFDALPGGGVLTLASDAVGHRATPSDHAEGASHPAVIQGEAGSIAEGTWVRFQLTVGEGIVKAALFKAYGCPHTLAVSAWITEQLPGRPRSDLVPGTPAAWLKALEVPVEKLGRLLTVEDALRATLQHWVQSP
jgi:cysteine desulfurase